MSAISSTAATVQQQAYVNDTNYQDEWEVFYPQLHIDVYIDGAYRQRYPECYDQCYPNCNTDGTSTCYLGVVNNTMTRIKERYYELFGLSVSYSVIDDFVSLADECDALSGNTFTDACPHASNEECTGYTELHHKNIYNIAHDAGFPDTTVTTKVIFTGHEYCVKVQENGEFVHYENTAYGMSWCQSGIAVIAYFANNQGVFLTKTVMHEIGHFYLAPDHYSGSTAGFSDNCIFGVKRNNFEVASNLLICEGCQLEIRKNLLYFDHSD